MINKRINFLNSRRTVDIVDDSHFTAEVKNPDQILYEHFLEEYDSGDLKFNDINFRPGAKKTTEFGIEEGYKRIDGEIVWGYVRIHQGIDRAGANEKNGIKDSVIVPFDFNRSRIYEYGDKSYGTLSVFYNDCYEFEFRIAHMNPDQNKRKGNEKGPMKAEIYKRLKKKDSFMQNEILGSAGTWGLSTGAHTHTEIKSMDETCEVFDLILKNKYGEAPLQQYTKKEIIELYRKQKYFKDASEETILKDYNEIIKSKKIIILNQYKCQYVDGDGKIKTRYSTWKLFNGL